MSLQQWERERRLRDFMHGLCTSVSLWMVQYRGLVAERPGGMWAFMLTRNMTRDDILSAAHWRVN